MEGFKINNHHKSLPEIDFKKTENITKFFSIIKKEYFTNLFRILILLVFLSLIYIIYYTIFPQLLIPNVRFPLDQIVFWSFFLFYLFIYFFQLTSIKFSPALIKFLNKELSILGFQVHRKYKTGLFFSLFNSLTVIIFILISMLITYSTNYIITSLIVRLIVVYFFSSTIIPILRGILHDKFIIKLKAPYFIQFELQFKLIKPIEVESQMIRIYMTSNKLGIKSNQYSANSFLEISNKRWLPRKGRLKLPNFLSNSNLYFYEYSTIINFKEQFLNIVSAVREWDIQLKLRGKINV